MYCVNTTTPNDPTNSLHRELYIDVYQSFPTISDDESLILLLSLLLRTWNNGNPKSYICWYSYYTGTDLQNIKWWHCHYILFLVSRTTAALSLIKVLFFSTNTAPVKVHAAVYFWRFPTVKTIIIYWYKIVAQWCIPITY